MKTTTYGVAIGDKTVNVPVNVFSSLDEAIAQAGSADAVLELLNDALLPRFAAKGLVTKVVQQLTNVPFLQIKDGNGADGKPKMVRDKSKDSDAQYSIRALKASPKTTIEAVQQALDKVPLSLDIAPKTPRGVRLANRFSSLATELLSGKKDLSKVTPMLTALGLPAFQPSGTLDKDVQVLGRLLEQIEARTSPLAALRS